MQIERPVVLGTRDSRTQRDAEILDVEGRTVRQRIRRMRTFLEDFNLSGAGWEDLGRCHATK